MVNIETVAVQQSGNDLPEDVDDEIFRQRTILTNVAEELTAFDVFHDKITGIALARTRNRKLYRTYISFRFSQTS